MKNLTISKENIDLLMKEKEFVRHELLLNLKILFTSLYSFLGVFGVLLVVYYDKENNNDWIKQSYVLFIIQQIGMVVLLFNVHVNAMVMTLAGYCNAIEQRINNNAGEKISIWESVIIRKIVGKPKSIHSLSIFLLNLIYVTAIIWLGVLIQKKELENNREYDLGYLFIGAGETLSLVAMAFFLYRQKEISYRLAKLTFEESLANHAN